MKNLRLLLLSLLFLVPTTAEAQRRVNVNVNRRSDTPIHHTGPIEMQMSPLPPTYCWPHGCGGISDPTINKFPEHRAPGNLAACYYGRDDVLMFEREGEVCAYVLHEGGDLNERRVAARKEQYLRAKARKEARK
jgi:hypothetical protein